MTACASSCAVSRSTMAAASTDRATRCGHCVDAVRVLKKGASSDQDLSQLMRVADDFGSKAAFMRDHGDLFGHTSPVDRPGVFGRRAKAARWFAESFFRERCYEALSY
jgi:hypothetical protein